MGAVRWFVVAAAWGVRHRVEAWTPRRRRLVVIGSGLLVVVMLAYGVGMWRARVGLADQRAQLDRVTERLATTRADLDQVLADQDETEDDIDTTRSAIRTAVDTRIWIDAVTANTQAEIDAVAASQSQVDLARLETTTNSNEAHACLEGVSEAVAASRHGDGATSVAALQAAADHCTHTLAIASGAQFPYDFPDPHVLRVGGTYYGYSTNSGAGDIQVIRSADLVSWELVGDALAELPAWAAPHATWAPAVLERDGSYVVYYTVREASTRRQCISRAVASSPVGPFHDDSARPLVCESVGSIDPSPFVDRDGQAYLLWKSEAGGEPPRLWSQQLTPDGRGLTGQAHVLVDVDRRFERGVVEAPSMVYESGTYFLVYAGADWNSRTYTTAYATCAGPAGPCTKPADGRILRSGPRLAGPGGVELFRSSDGALWAAFHAFSEPNVGYPSSRYFHLAPVRVANGRLVIDATT